MQVNIQIPDDVARSLAETGGDLSRRALEAFALEELRAGHITEPQLRKMLGLSYRRRPPIVTLTPIRRNTLQVHQARKWYGERLGLVDESGAPR